MQSAPGAEFEDADCEGVRAAEGRGVEVYYGFVLGLVEGCVDVDKLCDWLLGCMVLKDCCWGTPYPLL